MTRQAGGHPGGPGGVNAHAAEAKGDGELINNSSILDAGTAQALEPEPVDEARRSEGLPS
jgi:hypothetical protein